jgi:hypothetical protein
MSMVFRHILVIFTAEQAGSVLVVMPGVNKKECRGPDPRRGDPKGAAILYTVLV